MNRSTWLRMAMTGVVAACLLIGHADSASALPGYTCGTQSGGNPAAFGHITSLRVGHHPTYDRFVVQFAERAVPAYTVTPKSSARFWLDPSNQPVTLRGTAGIKLVIHPSTTVGSYSGPASVVTGFPQLLQFRRIGDFEGYTSFGLGLAHQSCKRVFVLSNPTRLVIDVPI